MQINSFKSTRNNRKLNENQKSEHFLGVFEEKFLLPISAVKPRKDHRSFSEKLKEKQPCFRNNVHNISFWMVLCTAMAALFCPSTLIFCSPHIIYQYNFTFTHRTQISSVYVLFVFLFDDISIVLLFATSITIIVLDVVVVIRIVAIFKSSTFTCWTRIVVYKRGAHTITFSTCNGKNEYNKFIVPSRDLFNISATMWFVLHCSSLSWCFFVLFCFVLAGSFRFNVEFLVAHCWSVRVFLCALLPPKRTESALNVENASNGLIKSSLVFVFCVWNSCFIQYNMRV